MGDIHFFTSLASANRARGKLWDPECALTPSFHGLELGGEVGEAQNIIKKLERERLGIKGSRANVASLGEELADVIICASIIANIYDIDLRKAIIEKFNATSNKMDLPVWLDELGIESGTEGGLL